MLAFVIVCGGAMSQAAVPEFIPNTIPPEVRAEFQLDSFYQRFVSVGGMPVVGSAKVSDAALGECAWIVSHMLERRPDILKALAAAKVRFAVMASTEYTTDLPEHAHLKPRVYWDRRARGLGATPSAPAVSGGEENLLAFSGDPYPREIICIHEFAHAIHGVGMKALDPSFDQRLRAAYKAAIDSGLWKSTYAAVNHHEYWAEAVQSWFDNNDSNNALHNDVNTRAKLKAYDPTVAELCAEVFGDIAWRYQKPPDRQPDDRAHLAGYDASKAPRFQWRDEPLPEHPRVSLECAAGTIELELSGPREALGRLLEQIKQGYYSGGRAVFTAESLKLEPNGKTPDETPVPADEGRWTIAIGTTDPGALLSVSVVKGGGVLARIIKDEVEGVRTQRIIRLN